MNQFCLSNLKDTCKYVQISERLIDKKKQSEIYALNYMVFENIYRQLGVNVIWYEDYSEIPTLLKKVFH